ncbi:hypothetical protein [Endozoicomonas sp. ALE010]|uniref:hypothetical protein n=1 Tax=Endozoicomonas sp. ALE010 TaxID=3403081 RepID=UPI003BB6BD8C
MSGISFFVSPEATVTVSVPAILEETVIAAPFEPGEFAEVVNGWVVAGKDDKLSINKNLFFL